MSGNFNHWFLFQQILWHIARGLGRVVGLQVLQVLDLGMLWNLDPFGVIVVHPVGGEVEVGVVDGGVGR